MPAIKTAGVKLPTALENEARETSGLTYLSLSALIRVGLGMLAGYTKQESLERFAKPDQDPHGSDSPSYRYLGETPEGKPRVRYIPPEQTGGR